MFCWFYKLMISNTMDRDCRLPKMADNHIHRCTSCRDFYDICLSFEQGLSRQSVVLNHKFSERINHRVVSATVKQTLLSQKARINWKPILTAASVAMIISLLILSLVTYSNYKRKIRSSRELLIVVQNLGDNVKAKWSQPIEQSLAGELQNLVNDTESAVRFLVACVPPPAQPASIN